MVACVAVDLEVYVLKRGDEGVGGAFRFQLSYGSELAGFVFPAQGKQIGDSAV